MINFSLIIQARMGSSRLPAKVLAPIGSIPLVLHIVDRINLAREEYAALQFKFAISNQDPPEFESFFAAHRLPFMRGDHYDVMQRYIDAAAGLGDNDYVVRLTGDNPFFDYKAFLKVISYIETNDPADLIYPATLPLGMGFEVVRAGALRDQLRHPLEPHHREHVTTYIKEHRERYLVRAVELETRKVQMRLTVDYPEDLAMAEKVYQYFSGQGCPFFTADDLILLYQKDRSFFSDNLSMEQRTPLSYEERK